MAGGYEHAPDGLDGLVKKLRRIQRDMDSLRSAMAALGIRVDGATGDLIFGTGTGDVQIQAGSSLHLAGGDLLVDDGSIIASGGPVQSGNFVHGSDGWRLRQSGNAEFNDITLRGGIVGNDALTSPVAPLAAHAQNSGFALSTTATAKATATIPVPSGYSQALVLATMTATGVNHSGGQDFFDGYADINAGGAPGGFDATSDGPDASAIGISHTSTALLPSLGSSFTVRAMLRSGGSAWSADIFNSCNVDALVLFLR